MEWEISIVQTLKGERMRMAEILDRLNEMNESGVK